MKITVSGEFSVSSDKEKCIFSKDNCDRVLCTYNMHDWCSLFREDATYPNKCKSCIEVCKKQLNFTGDLDLW